MNTSAEARVIASFAFIVALLFGAWGALDHLIAGPPSFLLPEPEPAWARALGGAAVMLGVLTSLGGVLYFLARW